MKPKSKPEAICPVDGEDPAGRALELLDQCETSLTAAEYGRQLSKQLGLSPRGSRQLINRLVGCQELSYVDLYGSTRIQRCFLKPVQISPHFILSPPDRTVPPDMVTIRIAPGISFGSGHHPTTQMCLELMDHLFFETDFTQIHGRGMAADVGSGSGVLALAACAAGVSSCRAWEIDPVSVNEARRNIRLNNMGRAIELQADFMPPCPGHFSLLCANLRYPTLMELKPLFYESLTPGGYMVLSGIREWEIAPLTQAYTQVGLTPLRTLERKQWGALLLRRD
ncbi:MAG: 50S ribosomal protein L11 methyltransferase [Desulfobacterales bacterium]|nr:50S ribosomal protein L11 methyltransferase [Desulfobacterales bacterium]